MFLYKKFNTKQFTRGRVFRVQHLHEVVDVGSGQPKGLDLGQLGVARNIGNAISQRSKSVIDGLGSSPLLFVTASGELATATAARSWGSFFAVDHHQAWGAIQVGHGASEAWQPWAGRPWLCERRTGETLRWVFKDHGGCGGGVHLVAAWVLGEGVVVAVEVVVGTWGV